MNEDFRPQEILFGLGLSTWAGPGADPVTEGRRAAERGFDFVSASDHLHGSAPTYEPWTMLSWVAAATRSIRVVTRVLAVPYRHPAVLAKMAESFDRLSDGRLVLGLGGGAVDEEFRALGLGDRSPRDKVDGLEEAIRIARGVWSEETLTFSGRLYRTEGVRVEPKPEHRIPIWLGTYGKRALGVTGRLADGWIPSLSYASPERIPIMRERILEAASAAGRPAEKITCVYNLEVRVDGGATGEPAVVAGSPEAVAERIIGFLDLGFRAFNLIPVGPDRAGQVERLAEKVVPAVREAAR